MTSDPDVALQRAIADACLGIAAGEAITRDLRAFLEAHGVAPDDIEAMICFSHAPARLAVYRSLIRNGLGAVVMRLLPRTRARLDASAPGRFEADLAAFAHMRGPRTHFLRDVPAEFLAWVRPRWRGDAGVPPYILDLASYELTHFEVAASASSRSPTNRVDVALDRPLAFVDSLRLLRCGWAVHALSEAEGTTEPPEQRDVRLLAYRDEAHAVLWLELTPFAGDVLASLVAGETLGKAVERTCAGYGVAPAPLLADIARLLTDLGARGVLLGARGG